MKNITAFLLPFLSVTLGAAKALLRASCICKITVPANTPMYNQL